MVAVYHKHTNRTEGPVLARALLAAFETQKQAIAHMMQVYRAIDRQIKREDGASLVVADRIVVVQWRDDSEEAACWALIAETISDRIRSEGRIDIQGEENGGTV